MLHLQISKNEKNINLFNSIGGVMINMLALKAVDPGFDP